MSRAANSERNYGSQQEASRKESKEALAFLRLEEENKREKDNGSCGYSDDHTAPNKMSFTR